jgi:hypothetical protein
VNSLSRDKVIATHNVEVFQSNTTYDTAGHLAYRERGCEFSAFSTRHHWPVNGDKPDLGSGNGALASD